MAKRLRVIALIGIAACGTRDEKSAVEKSAVEKSAVEKSAVEKSAVEKAAPESLDARVTLCDGKTSVTVPAGTVKNRENGQAVADALMAQWRQQHADTDWEADVVRSHPRIPPPADNRAVLAAGGQREGHAYGHYSEKDVLIWQREIERAVLEGARVFHDADALASTVGVSCDMCHPDAASTHPETYPKFQVQLGRVVLLRDMINWCIEHPLRAPALAPDDPRMRALEAYIYAQRKGVALDYGKH
jgi:thiosulfate dehydrogenase